MSRMFNDYLDSIGYFDIQEDDTEWAELSAGDGKRKALYISNKGVLGRQVYDAEGNGDMWPVKPHKGDKHGHLNARWTDDNGDHHEEYIHRLVAENFIYGDMSNGPNVLHRDDDPSNNRVENLRWGTQKENYQDSVRNGSAYILSDEDRERSYEKSRKPVIATNLETGERVRFRGVNDAARGTGAQEANLCKVLSGKRKATVGWYYEYERQGN